MRLAVVSCGGVFFDLRRDGVKNKRLFLNGLGISPSCWTGVREGVVPSSSTVGVSTSAADVRAATDGGEASAINAVVEASSKGDMLYEEPRVGGGCTGYDCPCVASGSIAGLGGGKSVISIPSGEPKP